MDFGIVAGDTDKTIYVRLRDSTTGLAKTGLVYNSTGAVCSYVLPGAARAAITLATQTVTGAHSDGGFVEVDATNCKGLYRLDLPDAAIASGAYSLISIEFDGIIEETVIVPLSLRKSDVRQFGGTNGTFASGRPEVNMTHIAGSAVSTSSAQLGVNVVNYNGQTAATSNGYPDINVLQVLGVSANSSVSGNLDVNVTHAAGTAWGSGAITAASIAADAITAAKVAADVHQELIELAFTYNATADYAGATAGSLVKEIADNAGGGVNPWVIATGTIGATGNDTTHLHLTGLTYGDDEINNYLIIIYDVSTSEYHARYIEDWADTGDLATVATLPFTPQDSTDTYTVLGFRQDVTGGSGLDAAGVRAAVGLASANLDTQLSTIDSNVDAILVDTGTTLQNDITAILADTNELQGDWANGGRLDLIVDAILADTGTDGVVVAAASKTGYTLTATTGLGNQTANITGTLSGTVGGIAGTITTLDALDTAQDTQHATTQAAIAALNDPTTAAIADAVWDEVLTGHATAGTAGKAISDILTDTGTTIPAQIGTPVNADISADIAAVKTQTAAIETDTQDIQSRIPAALVNSRMDSTIDATGMEAGAITAIWTTALTEAYRSTGAAGTAAQLLHEILQNLTEFAISGTTKTVKKFDGSTTAKTYTLDSDTTPTSITEAT